LQQGGHGAHAQKTDGISVRYLASVAVVGVVKQGDLAVDRVRAWLLDPVRCLFLIVFCGFLLLWW